MQVRGEARANVYYMTTLRVKKITPRSAPLPARDRLRKFVDNLTPTGLVCECFALVDVMIFPDRISFPGGSLQSQARRIQVLFTRTLYPISTSSTPTT